MASIMVDTDIVGARVRIKIDVSNAAVDDGRTLPRPRVFVTVDSSDLCDIEDAIGGLCLTPAQAERLGRALTAAAKVARR